MSLTRATFCLVFLPTSSYSSILRWSGDMRMLTAVNVPELRDKKNVILFSRHGDRPEADKMSGSDLDGDQFAM